MDGPFESDPDKLVVDLTGVPASDAYAWGVEAGVFMQDIRKGEAEGMQVFHRGNMGMIEMIAAEKGYDVDIYSCAQEWCHCWVTKRKHPFKVIQGG